MKQIQPGIHARLPVSAINGWRDVPNDDDELARMFEELMFGRAVMSIGGRVFDPGQLADWGVA